MTTEGDHQKWLAQYLDALGVTWCHVANEQTLMGHLRRVLIGHLGETAGRLTASKIGRAVGGRLRGQGVKAGMPDVLIFTPPPHRPDARGVAGELKTPKGRTTALQRQRLEQLADAGWIAQVWYGWPDAQQQLRALGYEELRR